MADVDALKRQRATSKRKFTRKVKNLMDLLGADIIDLVEVDACFDDITSAWKTVEEKHETYSDALARATR